MMICRNILGTKYTLKDSNIICTENEYKELILPLNLCIFLILGLMIPSIFFYKMKILHDTKELKNLKNRRIYGYFYNEFKDKYYFWDCLLIFVVL